MPILLIAVLEYAILASTFTIAKVAIGYADPLFLIGVRMVAAAPLMLLLHRFHGKQSLAIAKEDWGLFFQVSIFHIFLPFVGEFWSLQFISSAKTAIIYSFTPFIAAVLSYLLLKKKLSLKQTLGLIIGLLGLLPILVSPDDVQYFSGELFFVSLPEAVLLFAVVSASYAWFIVSKLMQKGYGISLINGVAMFLGGVFSLIAWYLTSPDHAPLRGDLSSFIFWTLALILVANVLGYNLYGWLLRHLSITMMSAIGFLCPLFASLYGMVLLDEKLGLTHLLALIMVSLGLWMFYKDEIKKHKIPA